MLVLETVAKIRREHFARGKGVKTIAREMGLARNTVRKVLRSGETSLVYEHGVAKETPAKFAKTMARKVGRENPMCRQLHRAHMGGCFNLAVVNCLCQPLLCARSQGLYEAGRA